MGNTLVRVLLMAGVMKSPGFHSYAGLWLAYASLVAVPLIAASRFVGLRPPSVA